MVETLLLALICCLNKDIAREILAATQDNVTSGRHLLKQFRSIYYDKKKFSYEERIILQHFPLLI